MQIVFRVDAGAGIGGGHVMRCLTLAAQLARRGASIAFLSSPGSAHFAPALARSGFPVFAPGRDGLEDCGLILARFGKAVDLLVCDSYGFDATYERAAAPAAKRLMVIDDLANHPHACDILLDTSFGRLAGDYAHLTPPGAQILAGERYALLRPEFAALRPESLARRELGRPVRRILVSLGLTDLGAITARVVRALQGMALDAAIDVVIGPAAESRPQLEAWAADSARINLHIDPPDMARLMCDADLAIGAGGTTTWERCCLGLPTVVLVLADNQAPMAAWLTDAGAGLVARLEDGESDFRQAVEKALGSAGARMSLSRAAANICDGLGAIHVANIVLPEPAQSQNAAEVTLRRATLGDARLLWAWRNDEETRNNSKTRDAVPWEAHSAWFESVLSNPNRQIFIAVQKAHAVGMTRFDRLGENPDCLLASIAVAPEWRGNGIGRGMLELACPMAFEQFQARLLKAEIAAENLASRWIFESCGFVPSAQDAIDGFQCYQRTKSPSPPTPSREP